jgi:ABC-2 type transport system ATP-binding protein
MLQVERLRKCYGELVAVDDLDLEARAGEILALLGKNGAGKSTTIQCIVGLLRPDSGKIVVDGIDTAVDPAACKRKIGFVPEVANVYEALTPDEFLRLKGRLFAMSDAAIAQGTERLLRGFDLWERRHEPIAGFSKGMVQRVALAAALITEPRLLILDEPHAGLDVETSLVLKELLREFARRGGTVLYCSHLLDVVETLADRIAILDRGRLLACGPIGELRSRRLEDLFRELTNAADPGRRAAEILGRSAPGGDRTRPA